MIEISEVFEQEDNKVTECYVCMNKININISCDQIEKIDSISIYFKDKEEE